MATPRERGSLFVENPRHPIYEAGLLGKVVILALSTLGWYALFRVFAKILEWILLPEAEVAILLASFAVWSVQAVVIANQVATACASSTSEDSDSEN
jgi:hypothetical protein